MNEAETRPANFIRRVIDEGLASDKHIIVHTRFPPELNGYLYIGYAKPICLNFGIVQDYKDQCSLRFDDTNSIKEDIEYVEPIKNNVEWLGFHWSGSARYSPDHFDQLHAYVIELINKGLAYVNEPTPEQIREYHDILVQPGKNSPYRDRSVGENLALFERMRADGFGEGKVRLHAKTDMASPLIVIRDPVLHRTKFTEYHQIGNKWCIYPMCGFIHCINDTLEGITHSLYTSEFQDNRRLYDQVLDNITIPIHPCQCEFSRLNLEYTVMSKRELSLLVTDKHVEGWDDSRMPIISGLCCRGCTVASTHKFCKCIGVTKQDSTIEAASLESCIREDLSENTPCTTAAIDLVKLVIENYQGEGEMVTMSNHLNKLEMGNRQASFSGEIWIGRVDFRGEANKHYKRLVLGKKVRLRNTYVIKVERVEKDAEDNIITIFCVCGADALNRDPADGRKIRGIIRWVGAAYALPAEIRPYDRLFSVLNPGAASDFLSVINSESLAIRQGLAEPPLKGAIAGKVFQFRREGYFCLDSRHSTTRKPVLNRIVKLHDTQVKIDEQF